MNFDNIGQAMLIVFEQLQNDEKSFDIIEQIDCAENDGELRKGFTMAITRLQELGRYSLVETLLEKTKGWF